MPNLWNVNPENFIKSLDKEITQNRKQKSKYVTNEALVLNRVIDEKIKTLNLVKRMVRKASTDA